jgi:hypothetical protein
LPNNPIPKPLLGKPDPDPTPNPQISPSKPEPLTTETENRSLACSETSITKNLRVKNCENLGKANEQFNIETETLQGWYKGGFKNGRPNGTGELIGRYGDDYFGDFRNGLKHGYGKMVRECGEVKWGRWKDGRYLGFV